MDRKLMQKSFSDVLEQAIKQRWGKKRKVPLVNFPINAKKCKAQPVGYSTSQQDSQQTSITDHESFSQSQPIISGKRPPFCAKQSIRGWTPPLKRYQEVIGRNATDVNSITTLKPPKNNSESKGYMDLQENSAQANSVNCEAKNGSENVISVDKHAAHEVNSVIVNSMEETKNENKDSLGSTFLDLKAGTGLAYEDQTSNIQQCIKSQCLPGNTDSVAYATTSYCSQSSTFDKEAEMENPTSLDQVSNESKECEMVIATVSGNNSNTLVESTANSEEVLSNTNTETDYINEDIFCEQPTQRYPPNDSINITDEENTIIDEEEIENPSDNREAIVLSPKANFLKNPLHMTNDIHNIAVNAFTINNAKNEDTAKGSTLCLTEAISSENGATAEGEKLLSRKEVQDTSDPKGLNKFLKKEPSKSMFTSFIYKSEMAQNQKCYLVSEQNDDKCITETDYLIDPRRKCTNRENMTGADDCVSGESTAIINSTNSLEEKNTNKESEKDFCFEIKPQSTQTKGSQSCDEVRTHTDGVYASTDKYSESKPFAFDVKTYTKTLETKFQNIFNFGKYIEEIKGKENISVFDNNEKSPITDVNITLKQDAQMKISENHHVWMTATKLNQDLNAHQKPIINMNTTREQDTQMKMSENDNACMAATKLSQDSNAHQEPITNINATPKQDTQLKISENHHVFMAATKLRQDSIAHQKSEDVSFLEETKMDKTKDDKEISKETCDGPSVVERRCDPSEFAFKRTEHTDREALKDMSKADCSAVVLPVKAANLQIDQSTLKFNDEDQNIRSPKNTKPLDVKENIVLPAIERRNVEPHETEPLAEKTSVEKKKINYQQTLEVTSAASSRSIVNNEGKIHSEIKEKTKLIVFKDKFNSQSNGDDFVFERETLTENNSKEKCIKCQRNTNQNETVNSENKFGSETAITNSETLHTVNEERACIADLKFTKENLAEESGSSEIKKHVHEMKTNCSRVDKLKEKPEDVIHIACSNSSIKQAKLPSTDLTNKISNDCEILSNNSKTELHLLKTENKTEDLVLTDNKECIQFKNNKQPENNNSVLMPGTATNNEVAVINNTDFSEMEDDFGLTASQILRIEDECQQKTFKPEMPPIQWAQKVKESRRKVQAVIQEIGMLNAMLKKARREVWQLPSNTTTGEGTSAAEDFNTFSRPTSHNWNRNLKSKFGQNMQKK